MLLSELHALDTELISCMVKETLLPTTVVPQHMSYMKYKYNVVYVTIRGLCKLNCHRKRFSSVCISEPGKTNFSFQVMF